MSAHWVRLSAGWRARRGSWWWTAAVIVVPVVVGTAIAVTALLALVDARDVRDQIELIKTGLAVGAGTGGAAALVLAGRRQWSTEQANQVTERSVADVRHDAAERRITDLYSKAADQLGSDKATVRLAGLYSLERLAQDTPPLRQTVVNLLCAYLRMPFAAPAEVAPEDAPTEGEHHDQRQELEVRRTVQQIFWIHLQPGSDPARPVERFWSDIDLDLTGAVLHLFDLKDTRIRRGLFGGARFVGWTRFDDARFERDAIFGGASFESSVSFRSTRFAAEARFRGATFGGPARFDEARFDGPALFGGVRSLAVGDVRDGAAFSETVVFAGAEFAVPPVFEHVRTRFPIAGTTTSEEPDGEGWLVVTG